MYDEHCRDFLQWRISRIALSSRCQNILTTWICSFKETICRALFGVENGCLDCNCVIWDGFYLVSAVIWCTYKSVHYYTLTSKNWLLCKSSAYRSGRNLELLQYAGTSIYSGCAQCSFYIRRRRDGFYSWNSPFLGDKAAKTILSIDRILETVLLVPAGLACVRFMNDPQSMLVEVLPADIKLKESLSGNVKIVDIGIVMSNYIKFDPVSV